MIPTHIKKPTKVIAYKFEGLTSGSADYIDTVCYDSDNTICDKCNNHFDDHGLIETNSGNAVVCPGNYIVNNPDFPNDFYPVTAEIFESTYDKLDDDVCQEDTCSDSISGSSISYNDYFKIDAARILLEHNDGNQKAIDYLESLLITTKKSKYKTFGEIMAIINDSSYDIVVSREMYNGDYIYFNTDENSEYFNQFVLYKDGKTSVHKFESKDYTANDWFIVE